MDSSGDIQETSYSRDHVHAAGMVCIPCLPVYRTAGTAYMPYMPYTRYGDVMIWHISRSHDLMISGSHDLMTCHDIVISRYRDIEYLVMHDMWYMPYTGTVLVHAHAWACPLLHAYACWCVMCHDSISWYVTSQDLTSHLRISRSHDLRISWYLESRHLVVSCHESTYGYLYMPTAGLYSTCTTYHRTYPMACHVSWVSRWWYVISHDLRISWYRDISDFMISRISWYLRILTSRDLQISRHLMSCQKWSKMDQIWTC